MRTRSVRGGCGGINSPHEDPASAERHSTRLAVCVHDILVRFSARERSETRSELFKSARLAVRKLTLNMVRRFCFVSAF